LPITIGVELLNHRHDGFKFLRRDDAVLIQIKHDEERIAPLIAAGTTAAASSTSNSARPAAEATGTPGSPCSSARSTRGSFFPCLGGCAERNRHQQCQPDAKHPCHFGKVPFHLLSLASVFSVTPVRRAIGAASSA
jgi:hypothetical protein